MSHLLKTFQTSFQTEIFYGHLNHVSFVENISKPVFKLKILQTNLSKLVEGRGVGGKRRGRAERESAREERRRERRERERERGPLAGEPQLQKHTRNVRAHAMC
jgi:hypothetical protein